jgi:carboxypeptidase PM20D1
MLKAGIKENILPKKASAVVNFRILSGDTVQTVLEHVRRAVNDPRVNIKPLGNIEIEPSGVSGVESYGFQTVQRTIREIFPGVLVAPSLVVGATDSRYYEKLAEGVFRFTPIRVTPEDLGRIHGANERVSVKDYGQAVRFYYQLIKNSN